MRVESEVLAAEAAGFELLSVFEARVQGQESMGYGYREGKSDTPVCERILGMEIAMRSLSRA